MKPVTSLCEILAFDHIVWVVSTTKCFVKPDLYLMMDEKLLWTRHANRPCNPLEFHQQKCARNQVQEDGHSNETFDKPL